MAVEELKINLDSGAFMPQRKKHFKVLLGERYGSLVVTSDTGKIDSMGNKIYSCVCDCGQVVERSTRYLHQKSAKTKSCGCQKGKEHITHGYSKSNERLYRIWQAMRWRTSEKNVSKTSYRKKGVKCCEEWSDYLSFRKWAIESGYKDTLTLDRIDNDGNYSPENCRWADAVTQANNKSNNTLLSVDGETHSLSEWSRKTGINYSTLRSRVSRQNTDSENLFLRASLTRDKETGRFALCFEQKETSNEQQIQSERGAVCERERHGSF